MQYRFSSAPEDMDLDVIHGYISNSYWSKDIPFELLAKAIENSVSFGLFDNTQQIAYGRFITDRATYAYLADVFVSEPYRSRGLGKRMLQQALQLPEVQGLRRIMLATRDAHALYERVGFEPLSDPEIFMQKWQPDVYLGGYADD